MRSDTAIARQTLTRALRMACAGGLLLALLQRAGSAEEPRVPPDSGRIPMAFLSDTQTPLWYESLLFGWDRNSEATDSIVAELCRRGPLNLFLLGDLVSFGPYGGSWHSINEHVERLRGAGISVHAILGNHELMLLPQTGEDRFQRLFPDHVRTGYVKTVDSVAVVLLNSNFGALGKRGSARQREWYARTLDSLQEEPSVLHIVVCCHHSPYSNSRVVGSSEEVQEEFVPLFLATPKCGLFLSGHAHACEQFRFLGKTFLVIGGGGGTRQPLDEGAGKRWEDLAPPQKPLFHYLELRREGSGLVAVVRGLADDLSHFSDFVRVTIQEKPPDRNPPFPADGTGHRHNIPRKRLTPI